MAKHPSDREIRERFSRTHLVSEKGNSKRLEAVRLAIENVAKVTRDHLLEELDNQEAIYDALDDVLDRAVAVFERRSGAVKNVEPERNVIRTMPLRMGGGTGVSTPIAPLVPAPAPADTAADPLAPAPDPNGGTPPAA